MQPQNQENNPDIASLFPLKEELESPNTRITLEELNDEINNLLMTDERLNEKQNIFTRATANECMNLAKAEPIPRMLFDSFWFEGELCILFASTNLGKSILAVQIGDSISRGVPIPGFKMEAEKQKVLYFDFELSAKQFENRYSKEFTGHFKFDDYLERAFINADAELPEDIKNQEAFLLNCMEQHIIQSGIKVVIIDNITYLRNGTEKAAEASAMMKALKALKSKYKLSMLVVAHTPKRDPGRPLITNDLQGSSSISILADSIFAVGESIKDTGIRYLIQLKVRFCEHIYHKGNVCVCRLDKPGNFLGFEFVEYGKESDHTADQSDDRHREKIAEAIELKKQGKSNVEIGRYFGVSEAAIRKWLKKGETELL